MRIPRSLQLENETGKVHFYWRIHNKEYLLRAKKIKELYLRCWMLAMKTYSELSGIKVHAYCVMDNHFHNVLSFSNGSNLLSRVVGYAHTLFGIRFNRFMKRSGKFADDRPKTSLIENDAHEMRAHMYVEANPIRSGKTVLGKLKFDEFCSFGFYAYGFKTEFSSMLSLPNWYLRLGKTNRDRQRKYRRAFVAYVGSTLNNWKSTLFRRRFIGSSTWIEAQNNRLLQLRNDKCSSNSSEKSIMENFGNVNSSSG